MDRRNSLRAFAPLTGLISWFFDVGDGRVDLGKRIQRVGEVDRVDLDFLGMGLIGVRTQGMFIALACVALLVLGYCAFRLWDAEDPLRWWAMLAYSLVLVQGVLGGLRVTQFMDELGIVHGTIGQLFFLLVCAIGLVTSRFWQRLGDVEFSPRVSGLKGLLLTLTIMVLLQLILAASMRHQHAGLAVPDFPLAYGKIWPPMDVEFVDTVNRSRIDPRGSIPSHQTTFCCTCVIASWRWCC